MMKNSKTDTNKENHLGPGGRAAPWAPHQSWLGGTLSYVAISPRYS